MPIDALDDAQLHRRGIWAREDNFHPWEFKTKKYRARKSSSSTHQQSATLFDVAHQHGPCQAVGCAGHLVERDGRFGKFYGCSRFPECRYARSANG